MLFLVLIFLAQRGVDSLPSRPVVSLGTDGVVIGRRLVSAGLDGYAARDYAAFYGIPFAKPPVGELRFKAPVSAPPLTSVLNADTVSQPCIQQRREPGGLAGVEDCLKLHVFTPIIDRPTLDVIVFIHGGGYIFGDAKSYGEEYLMDRNVVLVSIEYRLGILGFMSLEDEELPGNLGLLDQVMALKWVQSNIGAFGGNNNSVTLLGFSAGSASGFMHTLSPLSSGLFHRFIALSGSPLNPWSRQYKARENALKVGQLLNCTNSTSAGMLSCMRGKSAEEIVKLQKAHFQGFKETPFSPFAPVVDARTSKTPFLPDEPQSLLQKKKVITSVPVLFGLCKDEGLFNAAEFLKDASSMRTLERNWTTIAPGLLHYHNSLTSLEDQPSVAQKILKEYLGNTSMVNNGSALVEMMSHRNFFVGVEDQARLQAAASSKPVYMYFFAYRGEHSLTVSMSQGITENMGVSHGDDFQYPLNFTWSGVMNTQSDKMMRKHFLDMWVTFANSSIARFGSATWHSVSQQASDPLNYLYVKSPTNMTMMQSKDLGRSTFWKTLPFTENGSQGSGPSSTSTSLSVTLVTLLLLMFAHLQRLY